MKYFLLIVSFFWISLRTEGQSSQYKIRQIRETRQLYDKSVTTILDTTIYRLNLTHADDNGSVLLRMSMISYTSRMLARLNGNLLQDFYYSAQKRIPGRGLEMAYDNMDATYGSLRNKEVRILFDPVSDTVTVQNADSIINTLPGVPIGLMESVRAHFSNDYFTGYFNEILRTHYEAHPVAKTQWMQKNEVVSALQPRYADRNYTNLAVNEDSIRIAFSGQSFYRDPSNKTMIHGTKYCTGTEDGLIVYRTNSIIPWRLDMHSVLIFQPNNYSTYVETWITDIRTQFIAEK